MGEARQVMNRLTEALNRRDANAVADCFSENAEAVDPFGTTRGRAGIRAYWQENFEAFPDVEVQTHFEHEAGNVAIDEWTFTGTHDGPLRTPDGQEIPATGRRVEMRGADFATVENGLITGHRAYFDQMQMLGQLGLVPEEAQATA